MNTRKSIEFNFKTILGYNPLAYNPILWTIWRTTSLLYTPSMMNFWVGSKTSQQ